ncbi:MAG: Ig domain protein group 2 domain protein [Solirubrobacterales bacterium]|nr:Ig domain protein group 2 domain protein [Solirubrobacterales bacterium]
MHISPGNVDCRSSCDLAYPVGTKVTLTATPDQGSVFQPGGFFIQGIGVNCESPCTVTMANDVSVIASFNSVHWMTVNKAGTGTSTVTWVESDAWYGRLLTCGSDCAMLLPLDFIGLHADAAPGSKFIGWSNGPCKEPFGPDTDCAITLDADSAVTATFDKIDTPTTDPGGGGTTDPGGGTTGGGTPGGAGGAGTPPPPGGTPIPPPGTTVPPTTTTPSSKLKFRATGKRRGKLVTLSLRFSGGTLGHNQVTIRLCRASGRSRRRRSSRPAAC